MNKPLPQKHSLSYLITVSRAHLLPAQMLLLTLRKKTKAEIVVVGNLNTTEVKLVEKLGAKYIDENSIDYRGRLPQVDWQEKYRTFGWYKQMFIRLCIDTFMNTDQVVILDSEVFAFDNWDEDRLYDEATGQPKYFYWTPEKRKPEWDYKMYRGAAYLLSFLPECKGIMEYANSDNFKRHISGVVLFSTKNVAHLWDELFKKTDLKRNIDTLFNKEPDLAFSDHDFYGLAVEYGIFDKVIPTVMHENLLGWYDNHEDKDFLRFQKNAMWSMCQDYISYGTPESYFAYMKEFAEKLNQKLPAQNYTEAIIVKNELSQSKEQPKGNKMNKSIKKVIKKTLPQPVVSELARPRRLEQQLTDMKIQLNQVQATINNYDSRLDILKAALKDVEHYQPAYNVTGVIETPARDSRDRCIAIESALGPVAGKRVLDIGSSLGYVCFYLSDRGSVVQGWESNPQNAEAARLIQGINGVSADFRTKELNLETVATINPNEYDLVIVLSVFHHIIRFNGLEYTQKLIKELVNRVPVLVVELAKKGEDSSLSWDASQPKDELAIFDLVKDSVEIKEIGRFSNHLSSHKRPLYIIRRRQILTINNHEYAYSHVSNVAYKDARVAYDVVQRRYYFSESVIIKEYILGKGKPTDTIGQILNEIQLLTNMPEKSIYHQPELVDFEVRKDRVFVAIKRISGKLLSDTEKPTIKVLHKIMKDVLKTLAELEAKNISHNDVRQWNILVDEKGNGWLIDYGLAGPIRRESDIRALLNAIASAYANEKLTYNKNRTFNELSVVLPGEWRQLNEFLATTKDPSTYDILNLI